jgi:pilus assembly protein CpaB
MYEGETILDKKIVNQGEGGVLSALLPAGMRAYGLTMRSRSSAGGFVLPNDRVDVILTRKIESPNGGGVIHKSETVITNARVLTINQVFKQSAEAEENSIKEVEYVSLELPPAQADPGAS